MRSVGEVIVLGGDHADLPSLINPPSGCNFCTRASDRCAQVAPTLDPAEPEFLQSRGVDVV
jgi:hypothetical protein